MKKVLILGSGALKIGEAGEFDYSGSQAIKALKEEGIKTILINPNIATIQTSKGMADEVYFVPVLPYFVEEVIRKEKPDGIFLGFGGQTALNCGIELYKKGVLKKFKVQVLGTSVKTIIDTEDRKLFVQKLNKLGLHTPRSIATKSIKEALKAARKIGLPVVLRGGFALGGAGSAVVQNENILKDLLEKAFSSSPQVLVEEYLGGWKEIEYEVVRDKYDNCITVCNMENLDPMGIHTGESIVVAPSQTLSDYEYFKLRRIAILCIKGLGIIGECNIQFAVNPKKFEYRIIEVNARLSRSSALASKATGYPLAFVAAKLSLGYGLFEVKNSVTQKTSAFFEPALDYIVVKIPRWDLAKFEQQNQSLGTEMKSVGEVMAIGRSFGEALQKAVRSLDLDYEGLMPNDKEEWKMKRKEILEDLKKPAVGRLNRIAIALYKGASVSEIAKITGIDQWFLYRIANISACFKQMEKEKLNKNLLKKAKLLGFSDNQIARIYKSGWKEIRNFRKKYGIEPIVHQIDTLAGEFPAKTNYLYLTYHGLKDDLKLKNGQKRVAVLGSGSYRIGSSVEFDWCAVTTVANFKARGFQTTVINCNPETVSTDYDISDRLYFEELTLERVLDIYEKEKFSGVVLSVGGQTPNNLSSALKEEKLPILGTDPKDIDRAEDRNKFSALLDKMQIPQPAWISAVTQGKALKFVELVDFPVLLRPSYVLSGTSMRVVYNREDLMDTLKAIEVNKKYPLVISQFIDGAQEVEVDAVACEGNVTAFAILTHVEDAGVHSGDATILIKKDNVEEAIGKRIEEITSLIAKNLKICGPFNIQFLVKHATVLVIECNLRASRSFPFTSKTTDVNLIDLSVDCMLNKKVKAIGRLHTLYSAVKAAQFSFNRIREADPVLHVEMASTGEVGCFGFDAEDAYLKALLSTGLKLPKKRILLTIGNHFKANFLPFAKILYEMGYKLYTTRGTFTYLKTFRIPSVVLQKGYEGGRNNVINAIKKKKVDFIINLRDKEYGAAPKKWFIKERSDGYKIRRTAADLNIPFITDAKTAQNFIRAISEKSLRDLSVNCWKDYLKIGK